MIIATERKEVPENLKEGTLRAWHHRLFLNGIISSIYAISEKNSISELKKWLKKQAIIDLKNKTIFGNAQGIQIYEDDTWIEIDSFDDKDDL